MVNILVIHGAGMNMRGKVQTEIFGPMTLPEYDERIRGYANELDVEIEIFHSNIEGEVINRLYAANDQGFEPSVLVLVISDDCPTRIRADLQDLSPRDRGGASPINGGWRVCWGRLA